MKIDIIIIQFGGDTEVNSCMQAITSSKPSYTPNYIVINNDPPNENRMYSKAINLGATLGDAEYLWLLNNDAIPLKGAGEALLHRLSSNPRIACAASCQLHPTDIDRITYGGSGPYWPAGIHLGGSVSARQCSVAKRYEWLNFASVMIRRRIFEKMRGLDETLELVYSDSDFCLRCNQTGYECWYEPASRVLHTLNASGKPHPRTAIDQENFRVKWGLPCLSESST